MGEAKRQMGVYAYLLAGLVGYLGGDPGEVVGRDGLLVTPRNVGLTLEGTRVPLQQKLRRAELLLARVARPGRLRRPSANAGGFGLVADQSLPQEQRATSSRPSPTSWARTTRSRASPPVR